MGQNNHSGHWGINPPLKKTLLFLAKPPPPPLNQQTVQALPPFRKSPSIYCSLKILPPLKVGFSVNLKNIEVFRP